MNANTRLSLQELGLTPQDISHHAAVLALTWTADSRHVWRALVHMQSVAEIDTRDGFTTYTFKDESALHVQDDSMVFQIKL